MKEETLIVSIQNLSKPKEIDVQDYSHPRRLGVYDIIGILGMGGTSIVYEGYNHRLGLTRAIKLFRPSKSKILLTNFESELSVSAKLRHPNIVVVHSFGEWNGLPYIEMEKLEGIGLDKVLKERRYLPLPVVTAIAIMVCRALVYAHTHARGGATALGAKYQGVVHNDIKPSNIMLLNSGDVKIIDFGISLPMRGIDDKNTDDGLFRGTVQYIAPEQLQGQPADFHADIYSFGLVMYEMITGGNPFSGASISEVMEKRKANKVVPMQKLRPNAPKTLCRIIEKCMEPDIVFRLDSTSNLLSQLEAVHKEYMTIMDPVAVLKSYLENDTEDFLRSLKPSARIYKIRYGLAGIGIVLSMVVLLILVGTRSQAPDRIPGKTVSSAETAFTTSQPAASSINKQYRQPSDNSGIRASASSEKKGFGPKSNPSSKQSGQTAAEIPENPDDAFLKRLRNAALQNATDELGRLLSQRQIADGEYYLYKARYLLSRRQLSQIEPLLKSAQTVTCRTMDAEKLGIEVLYTRARYLSCVFDNQQNADNAKAAMETWYTVKYQFRKSPQHAYYTEANSEIRRISGAQRTVKNE